ncbi:TetR family transcriptional regulator [Bacillus glycinifermentans]|uniref:TetR family transcriptional regulator n=1 Tax=Bacillus glycinifermentans TaxID=1664069 RepID=A0A0J6H888_9BACI|nr:TetR/AcrR family transcriptional regulator [Bacillus glycinifermentans]ATH94722.1 TetR/AcrR family transcriptional regulator [Bacillus glycinifermentans]KMM57227.1 TetR family transcriptional regulator [Bacillus glycinifermentans]KRT92003.1 TetR family transcriptional regulator [Bacillus glycinifermentans]MEC0486444.1 TetR/AcrR family transcriptional regulator [Bacillus glycinifermentans]MEC0494094.1 TetR/AcrR family transcriptional regulator [Bacillus glycinifermentans]
MKERMLKETIHLIRQKGFTFTMGDLAKQLAVSKRTIYECFASKDDLVAEVIDHVVSQIKEKEQAIAANEQLGTIEKIEQILIAVPADFEFMDIRLLTELKKYHYDQWLKLDSFLKDDWAVVEDLFNQGMAQGIIKEIDLPLFIHMYTGSLNQIYDPASSLKSRFTMGEMLKSAVDILIHGISTKQD